MVTRRDAPGLRAVPNERLRRFLDAPGRFAVYGTGAGGDAVFDALADLGVKAHAFVDSYRTGEHRGLEILSPEDALAGLDAVVTGSMYARDMTAQLRADGFEGPVLDLTVAHRPAWREHFDETVLDAAADDIARARALWADDASRAVFDAVLAHRRSLDPGDLLPPSPPYRHPAVPVEDGEWVLDVGAFDGDTALAWAEAVGPLGHVHAFEPAEENLAALRAAVEASDLGARITVHPVGCWRESGHLALHTADGDPSQFRVVAADPDAADEADAQTADEADAQTADGADEPIRVVALDDFVWERTAGRVHWIKMDVEGAEHEVLEGAATTLEAFRPKLAVCVYHRPRDLWELPLQLAERVPGYRLFLGHHSQGLYDTVCYARPPD